MNSKIGRIAGLVLHVLIGLSMIAAGGMKVFAPAGFAEPMGKVGLSDKILLIGVGELIAGVLLVIPRTKSLGTLLTSGFWGGVILAHMVQHESYALPSVFLALTWVGAWLRDWRTLASLYGPDRTAKVEQPVGV